MKATDFSECLTIFLTMYLPGRNISENTIKSYRDTFKLILIFSEDQCGISIEKLTLPKFNCDFIDKFLVWLDKERNNSISTRNQRLAAIHAFIRYIKIRKPEYLFQNLRILEISSMKKPQPELSHLSPDIVKLIIDKTDMSNRHGRRDAVLLSLLYDSAARVQELVDMQIRDVRLTKPYTVTLTGKGNKTRTVPISTNMAELLKVYLVENRLSFIQKLDYPLFPNHQGYKMTRAGVTYILKKYCEMARLENPLVPLNVSPHVFRHSRAMHMLQAGINLIYIRDFLGHVHVTTTEIYARTDTETKRAALEKANISIDTDLPDWEEDKSLMAILKKLCTN